MGLACSGLHLNLRGRPVLRGISARFEPGKVTVILGANGAGKSTLLACLSALREADAGAVTLDGTAIASIPAKDRARRIGLLPQKAEIHWDIDVRALVALGRIPHHGRWGENAADRQAIDAAMAATDITHLSSRKAQRLSGGEQARALLARALAGQPAWLLADEPLANLDPAHQLDALSRLKACAAQGMGVVLVLHDLSHAARVADQVLLLKDGAVLAAGSPDTVLTAELLAQAFGITVHVGHGADGTRYIVPASRQASPNG